MSDAPGGEQGGGDAGGDAAGAVPGLDEDGARIRTHVMYGLQAALVLNGVTLLVAAVLGYVKRSDVRGTLYESHVRHQLATFWVAVAGFLVLLLLGAVTVAPQVWGDAGAGVQLGFGGALIFGLLALGFFVYLYYRILKGWLKLLERRPMD